MTCVQAGALNLEGTNHGFGPGSESLKSRGEYYAKIVRTKLGVPLDKIDFVVCTEVSTVKAMKRALIELKNFALNMIYAKFGPEYLVIIFNKSRWEPVERKVESTTGRYLAQRFKLKGATTPEFVLVATHGKKKGFVTARQALGNYLRELDQKNIPVIAAGDFNIDASSILSTLQLNPSKFGSVFREMKKEIFQSLLYRAFGDAVNTLGELDLCSTAKTTKKENAIDNFLCNLRYFEARGSWIATDDKLSHLPISCSMKFHASN